MRLNKIIERFSLVSGFEMKDVSRYLPIIADCKAYFESLLPELNENDLRRAEYACAVYAFYRISQLGRLDDLKSFKVGDVQMNVEAIGEAAKKLWEAERENISDILDISGDFAFRSVRV
ncbi:MAG: hypothetical protein IJH40_06845 [Ruminococcus sp.]|uniref:hypothetical protein n=1 Tax=Ruminococcus sp. TaxID=41978 RepID=UPI002872E5D3|nr:hypothetical protein [Ruminococcus sp.]MBQ3285343.1 hypothetical protein [Ruminococcus sp.]